MDVLGGRVRDTRSSRRMVQFVRCRSPVAIWRDWNLVAEFISIRRLELRDEFRSGRMVTTLAAYFVLRAILDTASGGHPLPSILTAMFLLGTQTTYSLIQSYNTARRLPPPTFWTVCGLTWLGPSCNCSRACDRGRHHQFCDPPPGHAVSRCCSGNALRFRNLETGAFDGG